MNESKSEPKSEPKTDMISCLSYGVFWDIENCPIPGTERASNVVQSIRNFISTEYEARVGKKAEPCVFCCACDTRNLDVKHVEGLNRTGVDILHVNPVRVPFKVDADSKLKECIQKFVDHHSNRCPIFVITGDIDFASTIRTSKRRGFDVVLIFGANTSQDLKNIATEIYSYYDIITTYRSRDSESTAPTHAVASNYHPLPYSRNTSISIANHLTPDSVNSMTESMDVSNVGSTSSQHPVVAAPAVVPKVQNESHIEFDPQKLRQVMEVTGVERHIALRMLQICNGSVELTINAIFSD